MTDEVREPEGQQTPTEQPVDPAAPAAPAAPAPAAAEPAADSTDREEGKVFAILSYAVSFVGLPFFLIPLIMRNNEFSLYHAKQSLILWLAALVGSVVSGILMAVCIGVILWVAVCVFCLVLNIIGLINAVKLEMKPLPVIGKWGEDWFKGIKKT